MLIELLILRFSSYSLAYENSDSVLTYIYMYIYIYYSCFSESNASKVIRT